MKFSPHELFDCAAREILSPDYEEWNHSVHLAYNNRRWYVCDALNEAAKQLRECQYGDAMHQKLLNQISTLLANSGVKIYSASEFEEFEKRSEDEYCSTSQGARFLFLDFMANVLEDQPEFLNVEL